METWLGDETLFYRLQQLKQGLLQFTDTTNAYRLLAKHGNSIRYNAVWKKWLVWQDTHWAIDDGYLIHDLGLKIVRDFYEELLKTADYRKRIDIEKHAMQSESVRRRKALIEAASWIPELNVKSEELDNDPWLLNVKNGTIDLRSRELKEHSPQDLITRVANVHYDKEADCPIWRRFLLEIMNYDMDLLNFLQSVAGWAITGDTSEQMMFIMFGTGANGKSTFLNTIMNLMGEYAAATPTQTFMKKTNDQTNDLARLRGTRLVTTTETEQGKRLSEPLIKQITGNDRITARFLYGEYFSFVPTFKIFMATNHKPILKGTDHGIWRRIRLLPFTQRIPEDKQDKRLEEKLRLEGPGILNWLLEGVEKWMEIGLVAPIAVKAATEEYRAEMDVIGDFLKDRCVLTEGKAVKARELFRLYNEWCAENNERCCTERYFGLRLKEMGISQKRTSQGRYWIGLTVQN